MTAVALLLSFATIVIGVFNFRTLAKTQRYLIETQFHISRRWRALDNEASAVESDATLLKLRRHLRVLSVLGFEWLVRPKPLNLVSESAQRTQSVPDA